MIFVFILLHSFCLPGTKYDTTVGMAAGAFSEGDRFPTSSQLNGNWERTIAIYRTTYSHVTQVQCQMRRK